MAKTTKWQPNDTQKKFMEILKEADRPMSLAEINALGNEFKSGSINCLVSKGLVKTEDKEVQVVKTEVRKVYSLVSE